MDKGYTYFHKHLHNFQTTYKISTFRLLFYGDCNVHYIEVA
jgi:hypothetical protein